MLLVGSIMLGIGLTGFIAGVINLKLRWWNTTRTEFIFLTLGLIAVGLLLVVRGILEK